jgi:hypothetical protein
MISLGSSSLLVAFLLFRRNCPHLFFIAAFNSFSLFSKDSFWGITGLDEAFFFAGWWDNDFVCRADLLGAGFRLVIKGGGAAVGGIGDLLGDAGDLLGGGGGGGVAT